MEIFKPLSNEAEAKFILESPIIPLDIRYRLDSITFPTTLVNFIGDLKENELNKVYRLEAENLFHLINCASIVLKRDKDSEVFYKMTMVKNIIQHSYTFGYDNNTRMQLLFSTLTRYMLSILTSKNETDVEVKFCGEIPKKIFSFRQSKADTWFNEYVNYVLYYASCILLKSESDDNAYNYLVANTIWYLNKSQPFKYYSKPSDKSFGQTIARLVIEFASSMGKDKDYLNTNTDKSLFKDI